MQSLTFNHCKFISKNETISRNTPKLIGTYRLSSQRWSQSWVSLLVYTCVDSIDKHTLFQFLQTVWRDFFSIQVVCKLSISDRLLDLRPSTTMCHAMLVGVLDSVFAVVHGVSSWELSPKVGAWNSELSCLFTPNFHSAVITSFAPSNENLLGSHVAVQASTVFYLKHGLTYDLPSFPSCPPP